MKITKLFKIATTMLACVFAMAVTSCDNEDDPKAELKFNPAKVDVAPGATATATIRGGTAPFSVVSSDAKIATATADKSTITVTGVKEGAAIVIVTDSKQVKGNLAVTVRKSNASGLVFDKRSVLVTVGKVKTVTVKEGMKPFTVTSKDTKIATAAVNDDKITITGVKAGSTSVTVTDKDKKTGTISVTVK